LRVNQHKPALLLAGFLFFCGLSQLSRTIEGLFGLVVLAGIVVPLVWGRITGEWRPMGFTRRHLGQALGWGAAAGLVSSIAGLAVLGNPSLAPDLVRQLLVGIPFWLLLISPFQEFFFRGWFQSGLVERFGRSWGLAIATLGFTAWHYVSPIVDLSSYPLASAAGFLSTLLASLAYGVAFERSRNILAPWLAHAISGLTFVAVGAMDLLQVVR
jgi:membrane protease YdiL (CAAX protease family)